MNLQRRTARLQLIAANLTHLEAELEAPGALAALLDAHVPASWPPGQYDRDAMLFFRTQLIEGGPAVVGWYGWYAVREAIAGARELVGNGGFFGPPDAAGTAEVGYSMAPEFTGEGLATELVGGLLKQAFADARVRRVRARTTEENVASVRVLEKNGFVNAGVDPESGQLLFVRARPDGA